jgi:hypothetical protein
MEEERRGAFVLVRCGEQRAAGAGAPGPVPLHAGRWPTGAHRQAGSTGCSAPLTFWARRCEGGGGKRRCGDTSVRCRLGVGTTHGAMTSLAEINTLPPAAGVDEAERRLLETRAVKSSQVVWHVVQVLHKVCYPRRRRNPSNCSRE